MNPYDERKKIYIRLICGYAGVAILIVMCVTYAAYRNTGWKPFISASIIYIAAFMLVNYHFIKDIRALRRRERGEPDPPSRKNYWEQD